MLPARVIKCNAMVKQCDVCARCKYEPAAPAGLLQPLPIPSQAWQHISIDFIEQLPKSRGKDTILVVVRRLTKYGHFIPLAHPFSTATVAKAFLILSLSSMVLPLQLFLVGTNCLKELFRNLGTSLAYSSVYHPQSYGQTERLNQCLENYLKCMTHHQLLDWCNWLPLAKWCYNTSSNNNLKMSPFEALYGYSPTSVPLLLEDNTTVQAVADVLQARQQMLSLIKDNLRHAQARIKQQADKKKCVKGPFRWGIGSILSSSHTDKLPLQ